MENLKITDVRAVPGDSAFLIDNGKTAVLYDSGFAFTGYAVAENIRKALGSRSLDCILLTHSHYDHALGSAYIAKVYPNAKIVASTYAAGIFRKPSAKALMRELDRKAAAKYGILDYVDLIDELRVDVAVEDGDNILCGNMTFTVVALPGHTKCSVGFYLEEYKLLLGTETLGVYLGEGTYLPSYLVGYQMTVDAFRKAEQLDIRQILLPHYGIVEKEEAAVYLEKSKRVSADNAELIKGLLLSGKSRDQIVSFLEKIQYKSSVEPIYPVDAYRLNTGIMVELIQKELLQ